MFLERFVIRLVRGLQDESGNDVTVLFPCEDENVNMDKPKRNKDKALPYRAMVSQEYRDAHPELHFPDDDGLLGVLSKSLSESLFTSKADKTMVLLD